MEVPSSFDVVGDIAIIEEGNAETGKKILEKHKNINVVLKKAGTVEDVYRVRKYKILCKRSVERGFLNIPKSHRPKKLTETVHIEYGCRLKVDPTVAYFSVRLGNERLRIVNKITPGEIILVMFAGVGPYPVIFAKKSKAKKIYAIEVNPKAVGYMTENVDMNKVSEKIVVVGGDVNEVVPKLTEIFDRIVMPLPKESELYLDLAFSKLSTNGTVNLYKILHERDLEGFLVFLRKEVEKYRNSFEIVVVKAGNYAPGSFRYCFDIKCQK